MGAVPGQAGPLTEFDVQVEFQGRWVSLNDHLNYIVGGKTFENTSYTRRRFTVSSSMYDGDFEVHSVLGGVQEEVVIDILGQDQNHVTENYLLLIEAFSQSVYGVRVILNNHQETWRCFPAEYTVNRGQIMAHNTRIQLSLSIPRFPKTTHEVIA